MTSQHEKEITLYSKVFFSFFLQTCMLLLSRQFPLDLQLKVVIKKSHSTMTWAGNPLRILISCNANPLVDHFSQVLLKANEHDENIFMSHTTIHYADNFCEGFMST